MKKRKALKKEHLIIFGVLLFVGIALWLFSALAQPTGPSEMYQNGMLKVVAGVFFLASAGVLFFSSLFSIISQKKSLHNCPTCGNIVSSKEDRFCRVCGASLVQ